MKTEIQTVWALRLPPDDDATDLHEFFLSWYRLTPATPSTPSTDDSAAPPSAPPPAQPAVWIKLGKVEHLEIVQTFYPEARLGPAASFNNGLIFTESWAAAQSLQKKIERHFAQRDAEDDGGDTEAETEAALHTILKEDSLEDA